MPTGDVPADHRDHYVRLRGKRLRNDWTGLFSPPSSRAQTAVCEPFRLFDTTTALSKWIESWYAQLLKIPDIPRDHGEPVYDSHCRNHGVLQ